MEFTTRLRQIREEREYTQKQMAEFLGITPSAYGFYESGRCEPDLATLKKLANFFNVSIDYLLGRTDIPNQTQEEKADYQTDFTEEELKLIQKFRQSSDKGKKIIETIVEIESNNEQAATGK